MAKRINKTIAITEQWMNNYDLVSISNSNTTVLREIKINDNICKVE